MFRTLSRLHRQPLIRGATIRHISNNDYGPKLDALIDKKKHKEAVDFVARIPEQDQTHYYPIRLIRRLSTLPDVVQEKFLLKHWRTLTFLPTLPTNSRVLFNVLQQMSSIKSVALAKDIDNCFATELDHKMEKYCFVTFIKFVYEHGGGAKNFKNYRLLDYTKISHFFPNSRLMNFYFQDGYVDRAEVINKICLQQVSEEVEQDALYGVHYRSLMYGYTKNNKKEMAVSVFESYCKNESVYCFVQPQLLFYGASDAMNAIETPLKEHVEVYQNLMNIFNKSNIHPGPHMISVVKSLFDDYVKLGNLEMAKTVLYEFYRSCEQRPNNFGEDLYSFFIQEFYAHNMEQRGWSCVQHFMKRSDKSMALRNNTMTTLLNYYFSNDRVRIVDTLMELFNEFARNLPINIVNIAIKGYFKTGHVDKAVNLFKSTCEKAPKYKTYPDLETMTIMLDGYGSVGLTRYMNIIFDNIQKGKALSQNIVEIALRWLLLHEDAQSCSDFWRLLHDDYQTPKTVNMCIHYFFNERQVDVAMKSYEFLKSLNMEPDGATNLIMNTGLAKNGFTKEASKYRIK
ncbi:hypothetical protein AKO1_001764 [Acrasis kona]|uniref:Mitochondrial group I intron splicing factor CCM1 n=1 Tax=Acrasis kona TaxID=1008807 RepID=A0AAW2ZA24_9EUKA